MGKDGGMARPLRIEKPGGWYHVTARGNERKPIYRDHRDREHFLKIMAEMIPRLRVQSGAAFALPGVRGNGGAGGFGEEPLGIGAGTGGVGRRGISGAIKETHRRR